jgi:hypothetical protein
MDHGFWLDWIIARILSRECRELLAQGGHKFAPADGP